MTLAQMFLEKFDANTQVDVDKWAKGIPTYDDISKVSKEYWNKAREITQEKGTGGDYWGTFFAVLDDLISSTQHQA